MHVRRLLIPFTLTLVAIGCKDGVGVRPTASQPTPHFLRWAGSDAPQFSAVGQLAGHARKPGPEDVFMGPPNEISLDRNTAQFWAVRGEERSIQINYRSSTGDETSPFL